MHIVMHCIYFTPEVGGLESHVHYLCRALVARGHRVDMVTSRSRPELPEEEVMDGVHVWRTWFPARNPAGWAAHALGSIPTLRRVAREADILHAQAFSSVIPCLAARSVNRAPVAVTWHTSHFLTRAESGLWRPTFRWMLGQADYNLAASAEIAQVGETIAPGVSVEAVTNGVDTEIFQRCEPMLPEPPEGIRRIVVPRRLFPKNGVEYALRALPLILEEMEVEMVLIGDGPERERLERLVGELGVAHRTRFLGARPNREMPRLLSSGELAVFPSLMEATSVAALECMACEVPVAASRVGGLPEIVDEAVGGLFEPADPESLAREVVRLLADPELRERGRAGRDRVVASWSNDRLARRHLEVYQDLLDRRPARSLAR
jgi:glycosyltransferase involved in cell wall biosynthesis